MVADGHCHLLVGATTEEAPALSMDFEGWRNTKGANGGFRIMW
jgi:hypothetical protein